MANPVKYTPTWFEEMHGITPQMRGLNPGPRKCSDCHHLHGLECASPEAQRVAEMLFDLPKGKGAAAAAAIMRLSPYTCGWAAKWFKEKVDKSNVE